MDQIEYDIHPGEFSDAMRTTRAARTLFWLLCGIMILAQPAALVLVEYGEVLAEPPVREASGTPPATASTQPTTATAPAAGRDAAGADARLARAEKWQLAMSHGLGAAKFLAPVTALLMCITVLFAVTLSLVGRLGGMSGLIGSFYWSLLLLAMVVPWQDIFPGQGMARGAVFGLSELQSGQLRWQMSSQAMLDAIGYFGRFAAYPAAALVAWLIVQIRFASACAKLRYPHALVTSPPPSADGRPPTSDEMKRPAPRPAGGQEASGGASSRDHASRSHVSGSTPTTAPGRPMGALTERFDHLMAEDQSDEKDGEKT